MLKRLWFVLLAVTFFTLPLVAEKPADQPRSEVQLVEATVYELQHALRTGLITSEQLVQMYLKRIDAYESLVNAFIYINPHALDEARAIDAARKRGVPMGPLYGIPVLLKDNIDTNDMPTTAGSVTLAGSIPPLDATITEKLREAGAIILGKATLTEFANFIAIGMPTGYSSLGQYGFNPYYPFVLPGGDGRPALQTGGSSSGSGIGVNASLVTVAIGTETSGSILSPASANGVVGIKPTVGLVSRTGILPITADQDTAGPIARTVSDAAALLGVVAGYDASDPATAECLTPGKCFTDYTKFLDKNALKGARIAVPHVPYWNGFNADQAKQMNDAIAVLRAEGAYVADPYEIPNQADISAFGICTSYPPPATCSTVLMYGQKHDLNAYLTRRPNAPVHTLADIIAANIAYPDPAVALKYGQAIFLAAEQLDVTPGSADTIRYQADRAKDLDLTRSGLDAVFNGPDGIQGTGDDFDAILFPQNRGAGAPAKAGYPSIAVPGGFLPPTATILEPFPADVTFTGRAFSEPRLIALAYDFEQASKLRQPPYSTPPLASDYVHRP
ncbi:MAG: amidase family protein [Acidobacteriota bacterium]